MSRKALQIERHTLTAWQAGTLMWTEAIPLTSARHLADLYALAYRHGVTIVRHLPDEAALPTAWLTPPVWRRNSAWREHWMHRLGRHWKDVADPRRALQHALDDLEGDGGRGRILQLNIASLQTMLDTQERERAALSAWIKELES